MGWDDTKGNTAGFSLFVGLREVGIDCSLESGSTHYQELEPEMVELAKEKLSSKANRVWANII